MVSPLWPATNVPSLSVELAMSMKGGRVLRHVRSAELDTRGIKVKLTFILSLQLLSVHMLDIFMSSYLFSFIFNFREHKIFVSMGEDRIKKLLFGIEISIIKRTILFFSVSVV